MVEQLGGLLTLIAPEKVADMPGCSRYLMDGTSWKVGARVDGRVIWRTRQMDGGSEPECTTFEAACHDIMALAGLTCGIMVCLMAGEAERLSWCPEFPSLYLGTRE